MKEDSFAKSSSILLDGELRKGTDDPRFEIIYKKEDSDILPEVIQLRHLESGRSVSVTKRSIAHFNELPDLNEEQFEALKTKALSYSSIVTLKRFIFETYKRVTEY